MELALQKNCRQNLRGTIYGKPCPLIWHCAKQLLMLSLCVDNFLMRRVFTCGIDQTFLMVSANSAYLATLASAVSIVASLVRMYTLIFGSVPEGRMMKLVPSSSS